MLRARVEERNKERIHVALRTAMHSPLTLAAAADRVNEVKALLPHAEVNWQGIFGNTALHWAVANSNTNMALYLLEQAPGLNPDVQDLRKKTALHLAIGKGWYHFNNNEQRNKLEPPQAPVIQALIKKTSLDLQDEKGNTALHIAVMRRDLTCIEHLLEAGATVDIVNEKGQKPLDLLKMNYNEVGAFLRQYVSVYTLQEKIWRANEEAVLRLFHLRGVLSNRPRVDEVFEEKHDSPSPRASSTVLSSSRTPDGEEILDGPPAVLFEQAIFYMEDLLDPLYRVSETEIGEPSARFLKELRKLKDETLSQLDKRKIAPEVAQTVASQALTLSRKMANLTVARADVEVFRGATAPHKKTSLLAKILGAVIGAALGVAIGVMAGMAAGPVAAFTGLYGGFKGAIIGASLGAALGGGLGLWGTYNYMKRQHSLSRLAAAATEEVDRLDNKRNPRLGG